MYAIFLIDISAFFLNVADRTRRDLGASSNPFVIDNNPKNYEGPVAPVYITVGTGGAVLHKFNGKASYVAAQYMGFGFLDISTTNNGRNLTGTFYDSSDNSVEDSFTLLKSR